MTVASQVKQTLAVLKGAQGTLRVYSAQAQEGEARAAFEDALKITGGIIADLEKRVRFLEFQEPQYKGN